MSFRPLQSSLLLFAFATALQSSIAYAETIPTTPSNLAGSYNNGIIYLNWKDNANNETSQQIAYSKDNIKYNLLVSLGANATRYSYKIDPAATGTRYYKIRASNAAGTSGLSPTATIKLPTSTTSSTSTSTSTNSVFQTTWTSDFLKPVPSGATYASFQASSDSSPGFHSTYIFADVNYRVLANNSNPIVDILLPGSWTHRSSGTTRIGRTNLPSSFVVPDATSSDMPNNPTIIYNTDTKIPTYLNGAARPVAGGPIWGYIASRPSTHGGSGLAGGDLTLAELNNSINHALAINVWGRKYLSKNNGGFVYPADRADSGYNDSSSGNYYGGAIPNLKMGSRLAIPKGITASQLGITSPQGQKLFVALQAYGAYIVDNSAWDCLYINATADTQSTIAAIKPDIARLFAALKIVQ